MKRLTNARNRCVFCKAADEECAFAAGEFSAPCPDYKTYQRLSAIEDILGDDYDIDRLKEIVQADREGKCVVLPCRVGDKVYCIQSYFNDAKMRSEKKVKCRVVDFMQSLPDLFECEGMIYKFSDIGKIVFLTREEAEDALEKMKEGK